ncbi:MAG: Uma2 family endonuclease [Opitutales bacterium]
MTTTSAKQATLEDYRALPQGPPYYQLVDGELVMTPAPNFYHQEIVGEVFTLLRAHIKQRDLGKVVMAPVDVELHSDDDDFAVQPDVLFIAKSRLEIVDKTVQGAPDLVVEVLSESTATLDRGKKRLAYAKHRVKELWLVSPEAATVHVYRFAEDVERPVAQLLGTDALTSPLLPGFSVAVETIFARS